MRLRSSTEGVSEEVLNRRAYNRLHYQENRDKHRNNMYKYLYGISLEQYGEMLDIQHGLCAICQEQPKPRKGHNTALVPDHNHITGEIRALLCHRCNVMLGKIENNKVLAYKMLEYLNK